MALQSGKTHPCPLDLLLPLHPPDISCTRRRDGLRSAAVEGVSPVSSAFMTCATLSHRIWCRAANRSTSSASCSGTRCRRLRHVTLTSLTTRCATQRTSLRRGSSCRRGRCRRTYHSTFSKKKDGLALQKGMTGAPGPHDFLRRLARGEHGSYENFFNDILEPLFQARSYETTVIRPRLM